MKINPGLVTKFSNAVSKLNESPYIFHFVDSGPLIQNISSAIELDPSREDELLNTVVALLGELSSIIRRNRNAYLGDFNGSKKFIFLEKFELELLIAEYRKKRIYIPLFKFLCAQAFIGHEYESFSLYVHNLPKPSFLGSIFGVNKQTMNIQEKKFALKQAYQATLNDTISLSHLRSCIDQCVSKGCYVNPHVPVLLGNIQTKASDLLVLKNDDH